MMPEEKQDTSPLKFRLPHLWEPWDSLFSCLHREGGCQDRYSLFSDTGYIHHHVILRAVSLCQGNNPLVKYKEGKIKHVFGAPRITLMDFFLPYDHEKLWRLVLSPALGQALPCDGLLLLTQCDSYLTQGCSDWAGGPWNFLKSKLIFQCSWYGLVGCSGWLLSSFFLWGLLHKSIPNLPRVPNSSVLCGSQLVSMFLQIELLRLSSPKDTALQRSMKLSNWGWLVVWQIKEILNLVPWIKYKTDFLNEGVVSAKSLVNSSS